MIIHIGASSTSIALVKKGILSIIFSVAVGGLAISRSISVDLGIDISQAENFKKVYGLTQDAFEGKIGKSLTPILTSVAGEIKKGLLLFREKNKGEDIQQIIISGGTALMPGIDVFFANNLNAQVLIANPWESNKIERVPQEALKDAPLYSVVVGLALREE